jgi:predicted GTPase
MIPTEADAYAVEHRMASQEDISPTEAKSLYEKHGLEGIKNFCQEKINAYKKQSVKIAITGQSGAGKSSLINKIRNFTPKDKKNELYASVGVTETTTEIKSYSFPDNPLITIYDLPGAGTEKFPMDTYGTDMEFGNYDAFVILTKDRFLECDKKIATMIKEVWKKPFFFARTKMDATMAEEAENKQEDFDAKETEKAIRTVCNDALADRADRKIYLIAKANTIKVNAGETEAGSPNKVTVNFPDNDQLNEDIGKSLDGLKRAAIGKLKYLFLEFNKKSYSFQHDICIKDNDRDEGRRA